MIFINEINNKKQTFKLNHRQAEVKYLSVFDKRWREWGRAWGVKKRTEGSGRQLKSTANTRWEDIMNFKKAGEVISIIESHGHTALIVGGAVRDFVMKRPVPDIDLATDMPMDRLSRLFSSHDTGKSKEFGMLCVQYQGEHFEVLEMRPGKESFNKGACPEEKKKALFRADSRCRDFTINAMAMDQKGLILDPLGGQGDIKNKIIRAVREPEIVFSDDPLRLMRAVRFACALGFEIEPATLEGVRRLCPLINISAPERIGRELIRMASLPGKDFANGVALMERTGLLEQVLPEISKLKKFRHNSLHHPEGGVFEHTMAALRANKDADPGINLSILFHDAGKAESLEFQNGRPVYHGHDKAGELIIRKAGQRLRWSGRLLGVMSFVSLNHMKALRIGEMKPSKVFRLMTDPQWPVLKSAVRCDLQARGEDRARGFERIIEDAAMRLGQWLGKKGQNHRPVVTGRQVMEYTGLPRGPEIGRILELTTSWAIDNQVTDPDRIRAYVMSVRPNPFNCRAVSKSSPGRTE
jgi:tRNA nucleotidyltransferase/poly(A) polymerase